MGEQIKVWLVYLNIPYEGEFTEEIFDSLIKAKRYIEEEKVKDERRASYLLIEEYEVK